jgi:hypothetical protein
MGKTEAPVTLATIDQTYLSSSNPYSGPQLSADIAETPGESPPPPTDPNQLSRKRKRIASRVPSVADNHTNSSKRYRAEPSPPIASHPHHHHVSPHNMPLLPPEGKEQDVTNKGTISQPDADHLFALYAYLPPLWS